MRVSENFSREEFACGCKCGFDAVDVELVAVLEDVRAHYGKAVTITSGCRCESHNKSVGGAPRSKHVKGIAADIRVADVDPHEVYKYLDKKYEGRYGLGDANTFTHIDVRDGAARWTY
jgi:uncharacterized protein YcbK (DUF882 family)